jgi:hypothetical protein
MNCPRLELCEVSLSIVNGGRHAERASRISELTFEYMQELIDREFQHLDSNVTIGRLSVPPIEVALESMDDEAVARAAARGIYRALIAAL